MTTDCRLYLITPPVADATTFAPLLEAALDAADIACVLLRWEAPDETTAKKIVKALGPIIQGHDAALLIEGDSQLAGRVNADGVHVPAFGEKFDQALESCHPDRIVGLGGVTMRDEAMTAGEKGADYLLFGEPGADHVPPSPARTLEWISWWSEIFEVPCVGFAASLAEIGPLAAAGADFVALADAVWSDPRGPAAAIAEAMAAITAAPERAR
jgi:thiamine-phosphate pyrophosphorylase